MAASYLREQMVQVKQAQLTLWLWLAPLAQPVLQQLEIVLAIRA